MKSIKKIICFLAILVVVQFSFGTLIKEENGQLTIIENRPGPFMLNDTLFFVKDTIHSIFFDKTKNTEYYDRIIDCSTTLNYEYYKSYIAHLKEEYNTEFITHKIDELPRKWIELHLYNGEYYVYHPCDFMTHYRIIITDSTIVEPNDFSVLAISEYKKINDSIFEFHLDCGLTKKMTIQIIDKERGIAVVETWRTILMVDAEKAKNFPIIVNDCNEKVFELDFQEPNFE